MAKALGLEKVTLIRCGGGNAIAGAREQWNDGANTLAIAPGEELFTLQKLCNKRVVGNNMELNSTSVPSGELSRGRGGPRCMSMPSWRDNLLKNKYRRKFFRKRIERSLLTINRSVPSSETVNFRNYTKHPFGFISERCFIKTACFIL